MSARREFQSKKRILIKAGTGVITDESGGVSLGRFGHLVEQVAELKKRGKEVIIVSSGAVAMGKQKLHESAAPPSHNPRACAAAGQSGLMALYETLFRQKDIWHVDTPPSIGLASPPSTPTPSLFPLALGIISCFSLFLFVL
jgi:delta-1-pyrroline-5-carboxylate synthetase